MKTNKMLAAAVAVLLSAGAFAQTTDEIIDKHVAALGGADKLKSVNTIVTERSIAVQGMEIPSTTTVVVGKAMRQETSVMGNSMIVVVEGDKGWTIRPAMMQGTGEPEDLPAEQLKQQSGQLDPFGSLMNYKAKGTKIELVGTEKADGKDVHHLKVTTKDGITSDQYIDASTYLMSKIKATAAEGQETEIALSDYKDVDGIKFAHTMEIAGGQMGTLTMTTNKIVVNGKVDEGIFKKPAK